MWSKAPPRGVWLGVAELLLVIEIVSPGSEAMDEVTKRREYASAGISQYWVVDRDDAQTVTFYQLSAEARFPHRLVARKLSVRGQHLPPRRRRLVVL